MFFFLKNLKNELFIILLKQSSPELGILTLLCLKKKSLQMSERIEKYCIFAPLFKTKNS